MEVSHPSTQPAPGSSLKRLVGPAGDDRRTGDSPIRHLHTPLSVDDVESLRAGDRVLISGVIYAARDSAHKRLVELLDRGEELPVDLKGQVIYYVGPTPARPGWVTGAAGPTTSGRMDPYTPRLIAATGLKGMIGKGFRSPEVKKALVDHKAVYFAAVGGAGALIARCIKRAEVIAYPDLGAEALRLLEVENFPATVINDCYGGDLYEEAVRRFALHPDMERSYKASEKFL
ncbi:fumarate hydratase beta subunit [Moorella thermoacetica Y72]|uniref:Fumarate hydratase beta subunit n=1 Tax=Moorella thermoacetica Y72 TaxID=1325331 RepID=A0A0S6U955_NEOTH|nr:Fe-S-containing hydro-lyase [Moorella thermoacetica]GAF25514.1 fumarate hydratase beta subunit [Moorella thermoacetica Y72]